MNLERHRAPALWLVGGAVALAAIAAVVVDARAALAVLVGTLGLAAGARLALRGRRPEGVAVRSTWVDVLVLAVLAIAISVLATAPGV